MKINPVAQSDAISKYVNSANSTSVKGPLTANISDSVELSEGAQKFSALMKAAKETVEKTGADEEAKVGDIINRMNAGTYKISTEDVVRDILSGFPSNR